MLSREAESFKVLSMESITEAEAREFLEGSSVIHFGVIAEGEPYVSPMSFVVDGDRLLFRTKPGRRFRAIESEPVVSLEASDFHPETGDWISVVIRGRAAEVTDEETMQRTHHLLFEKYEGAMDPMLSRGEPGLPVTSHVFEVSIDEMTGRVSATGFAFRTKPGRI